ncbi:putative ribonuclease H-like domain-containing protein [Tanacetum coccineum]
MVSGNNYTKLNHNYAAQKAHLSTQRNMAPRAVLMKPGLKLLNTARPVNTAHPKTTVYSARPMSCFSKSAQSTEKSPYQTKTVLTSKNLYQKVNTAKGKLYTARPKAVNTARLNTAVVNVVKANQDNAVKASAYPSNMSYLLDFKAFDGGYVTFGGGAKGGRITSKGTLKTSNLDFEDIPTFVSSLMNKKYGLVVTDDYNRFTWVFFLASKDETSGILKSFITQIENLVDKKVKIIRCANGIEFKNRVMSEFCEKKGIKKEFSVARTPQQNGVAERRNKTLIEDARTMLDDSKLPTTFWAEAVNTACYVHNMVLVVKPHNKTPYELFRGRTSSLSFMKPFGCYVTILNTLDRLGDGPKWLFDIDVLTELMNYVPVVAGTNSNDFVGTQESIGVVQSNKETGFSQDYILMPLWKDGSLFDSSLKNANNDEPQPSNDVGKKDDEGGIDNQKRPKKSAQDVNTVGPSINTASTNKNTGSLNINTGSPIVTTDPTETTHGDCFKDEIEVDMSNISTTYPVPSTPNTRIHKEHSLDNVIGNVQFSVQTRRTTKTTNDQRFISVVYEGKTHKDLHTCLFACFLSQEEPKRIAKPLTRIKAIRLFLAYASFMGFMVYQMDVKSAFLYGKIEEEVYVDDIIFGSTKKELCIEFEKLMHDKFQMSSMGELTFFLGLQVKQKEDGIFISQDKYEADMLRKFGFTDVRTTSTPMDTEKPLLKDSNGDDVDVHHYRDSPFDLVAYSDSDYAGASLDRKSTTGGCQFLRCRLISWQCKKQTVVATSSTEAE